MMSLETIEHMTREAAREACEQQEKPYMVWPEDIVAWKEGRGLPIPFPMIGDYVPEGWEPEGDELFVDTSGFGSSNEPALTITQLLDKLEVGRGYAFVRMGQFQAYLQKFKKAP